jgi:hypothetical protein
MRESNFTTQKLQKTRMQLLVTGYGRSLRRFEITISVEDGSAARRESQLAVVLRASIFDLNKPIYERVFPYGVSGTRRPPCLHCLLVGAMTAGDPGQEF